MVAEALTNVAKYAQASAVDVEVRRATATCSSTVADDGVGGVDVGAGSGLRGLQDRLAAVDGRWRSTARRAAARGCARGSRRGGARRVEESA